MSKKCIAEKIKIQFTYEGNISSYLGLEECCRRKASGYKSWPDYSVSPFRRVKEFTFSDNSKLTFTGDEITVQDPPAHAGLFNRN